MKKNLKNLVNTAMGRKTGFRVWAIFALLTIMMGGASVYLQSSSSANSIAGSDDECKRRRRCEEKPTPTPTPKPKPTPPPDSGAQTVNLYYFREATTIAAVLSAIAEPDDSDLHGMVVTPAAENELIIYGSHDQRVHARQIIATLDLPRPGIKMEMWGIQISSPKPEQMSLVMPKIRAEIDRTQQAVRDTYDELESLTRTLIPDERLDRWFRSILEDRLFYREALHANRPLSVPDILLRLAAANDPAQATQDVANHLDTWARTSRYKDYVDDAAKLPGNHPPFERFFRTRGLRFENGSWTDYAAQPTALQGRLAVLEFALHYGRLVHEPKEFSPYSLQQSAEILNSRLQDVVNALNLDIQNLFVAPTLVRIGNIVHCYKDVEYAQVGKTTVSSLSGTRTEVTSSSVSAFDVTPPLRLSELLKKADELSSSTEKFVPHPTENVVGAMPYSQLIGLIAAFGEERSVWRELDAGVSLAVTPNILRNMSSAELEVDLKIGDPQGASREEGVRPLSRVSKHELKTRVYVNALDFFDLSAFVSQSTLGGGRGYVPIIGPVWNGLFGEIPVAGKLFSWRRENKTVYHDSLVLTNSFITPTVMGLAVLYPTELIDRKTGAKLDYIKSNAFANQWWYVDQYRQHIEGQ